MKRKYERPSIPLCTWCFTKGHVESKCAMKRRGERSVFRDYEPPIPVGELPSVCVRLSPQHVRDRERVR